MDNARLRELPPEWSCEVDTGGMFAGQLSVHRDPDGGRLPFLAVCRDGWGAGAQARRATLAEAKAHTEKLAVDMFGRV